MAASSAAGSPASWRPWPNGGLPQEIDGGRRKPDILAQRGRERFLDPRLRQAGGEIGLCQIGTQVDGKDGAAVANDRLAKRA
jgi:hypothetical protein